MALDCTCWLRCLSWPSLSVLSGSSSFLPAGRKHSIQSLDFLVSDWQLPAMLSTSG